MFLGGTPRLTVPPYEACQPRASTVSSGGRGMSFFDDADEARVARREGSRRRRPAGSARRPPTSRQTIIKRRTAAAVVTVIVVVLVALGVRSCQVSDRNSSLKDYTNDVAALIRQSDRTGSQLFSELTRGGDFNATTLESQIDQARVGADAELAHARNTDVPGQVEAAQRRWAGRA